MWISSCFVDEFQALFSKFYNHHPQRRRSPWYHRVLNAYLLRLAMRLAFLLLRDAPGHGAHIFA
jgi:uncharacterized BrkB/YihY/UPF0761 family membrane protein